MKTSAFTKTGVRRVKDVVRKVMGTLTLRGDIKPLEWWDGVELTALINLHAGTPKILQAMQHSFKKFKFKFFVIRYKIATIRSLLRRLNLLL